MLNLQRLFSVLTGISISMTQLYAAEQKHRSIAFIVDHRSDTAFYAGNKRSTRSERATAEAQNIAAACKENCDFMLFNKAKTYSFFFSDSFVTFWRNGTALQTKSYSHDPDHPFREESVLYRSFADKWRPGIKTELIVVYSADDFPKLKGHNTILSELTSFHATGAPPAALLLATSRENKESLLEGLSGSLPVLYTKTWLHPHTFSYRDLLSFWQDGNTEQILTQIYVNTQKNSRDLNLNDSEMFLDLKGDNS